MDRYPRQQLDCQPFGKWFWFNVGVKSSRSGRRPAAFNFRMVIMRYTSVNLMMSGTNGL